MNKFKFIANEKVDEKKRVKNYDERIAEDLKDDDTHVLSCGCRVNKNVTESSHICW